MTAPDGGDLIPETTNRDPYSGPLICDPWLRPDGLIVSLRKTQTGVSVDVSGAPAYFTDEEVARAGDEDWYAGLVALGQAYTKAERDALLPGSWRLDISPAPSEDATAG